MISHVVAFDTPMSKVYKELPPPVGDIDEVLAILFTGPCQPTEEDFRRTPLLVRRRKVVQALQWLKLNHRDYKDIIISHKNMNEYSENSPPVTVIYKDSTTNKIAESISQNDMEDEDGVKKGPCPFVVHGVSSDIVATESADKLKAIALKHLNSDGKMLAIGHNQLPESLFKNPQLYPQMFPWLFPYGHGGLGIRGISEQNHKSLLLMYYDK
ncbi:hypothetical protein BDN72DRAFT_725019, partial [Pluteus cervinus]